MSICKIEKLLVLSIALQFLYVTSLNSQIIAGHEAAASFRSIPLSAILKAKDSLHIAYGHSSHGQQIIEGVRNLDAFMTANGSPAGTYAVDFTGNAGQGVLDFRDNGDYYFVQHPPRPFPVAKDLGADWNNNLNYTAWVSDTRNYLNSHPEVNVIIWSWCSQAGYNNYDHHIEAYLDSMSALEADYPNVKFVYMTGHVDGTGLNGRLHTNNEIIRNYCINNGKILYDFEDIESWDPDGNYYGDKFVTAACNWDANGNGFTEEAREDTGDWVPPGPLNGDRNWALEWQESHTLNVDWYECKINHYHTQHLNDNLKAYAFWWLMARIAGWDGSPGVNEDKEHLPLKFSLSQNFPNPFNPKTTIRFSISEYTMVSLKIYDILGREIATLVNEPKKPGEYTVEWNGTDLSGQQVANGLYFYQLKTSNGFIFTRKMVLLK
ncbi:MAG: FlgD immunoglobulin-like domain containing protein [candidate division WOR-3 bacterium]